MDDARRFGLHSGLDPDMAKAYFNVQDRCQNREAAPFTVRQPLFWSGKAVQNSSGPFARTN
jgi:hypothetical protein